MVVSKVVCRLGDPMVESDWGLVEVCYRLHFKESKSYPLVELCQYLSIEVPYMSTWHCQVTSSLQVKLFAWYSMYIVQFTVYTEQYILGDEN